MITEDVIPISLVTHTVFCPRRAWLEIAGERTDTHQMQIGTSAHARVDNPKTARGEEFRALDVFHSEWGLTGRADAVRQTPDGVVIREYKTTPVRQNTEVTHAMRIQLALQHAAIESMGLRVVGTEIYFVSHNSVVEVTLAEQDFTEAQQYVNETRAIISAETAPLPLIDSPKCSSCSHASVCLPEERNLGPVRQRIVPAAPDTQIVHLTKYGARASIAKRRLVVRHKGEEIGSVPIERVLGIQVHGNIDLSSALIRELLWRDGSIVWCSGRGRVIGWAGSARTANGLHRARQHVASQEGRLGIAREMVATKIGNQATILRRGSEFSSAVKRLRSLQVEARAAGTWQSLIGYEGEAAAYYFEAFPAMFNPDITGNWGWRGRGQRPARDAVNAALNYVYGMLLSDTIRAVVSCGLDPHAGFIHSSNRNKPALALDLMEEFRAPIADSVVIGMVNNQELKLTDFDQRLGSVRIRDSARQAIIRAYERRIQTEFRHPIFDYRVTWRRAIEVQARQVLGVLDGSQPGYKGIAIR